jgi:hypothetical protein
VEWRRRHVGRVSAPNIDPFRRPTRTLGLEIITKPILTLERCETRLTLDADWGQIARLFTAGNHAPFAGCISASGSLNTLRPHRKFRTGTNPGNQLKPPQSASCLEVAVTALIKRKHNSESTEQPARISGTTKRMASGWKLPTDVIWWDEHSPTGEAILIAVEGKPTCFFPPRGGL